MHVCYRCGAHAGATAYAHVAPKYMGNACLMHSRIPCHVAFWVMLWRNRSHIIFYLQLKMPV